MAERTGERSAVQVALFSTDTVASANGGPPPTVESFEYVPDDSAIVRTIRRRDGTESASQLPIESLPDVADEELRAAYEAPFPDERYVAGARKFPSLVPVFPDDPELPANREAWEALAAFDRPFLTSFSDEDPVTAGQHETFQKRVAGAKGVDRVTIRGAGHFLQEEQGETVAKTMIEFIRNNPSA